MKSSNKTLNICTVLWLCSSYRLLSYRRMNYCYGRFFCDWDRLSHYRCLSWCCLCVSSLCRTISIILVICSTMMIVIVVIAIYAWTTIWIGFAKICIWCCTAGYNWFCMAAAEVYKNSNLFIIYGKFFKKGRLSFSVFFSFLANDVTFVVVVDFNRSTVNQQHV